MISIGHQRVRGAILGDAPVPVNRSGVASERLRSA